MRVPVLAVSVLAACGLAVSTAVPAAAHDHRIFQEPASMDVEARPMGPVAATAPSAQLQQVELAAPTAGTPSATSFTTNLTRNPDTSLLVEPGFTTPADECVEPVCREVVVDVPEGGGQTLYVRAAWSNPSQYVHVWGIAPDESVVGQSEVADQWDKSVGNETSLPLAEFTVPDPQPGRWRIQVRAVFGYEIPVAGLVSLTQGPALQFPRLDMRTLADRHLTQNIVMNTVFAGREWTPDEIAVFREHMPLEYRLGVLGKQGALGDPENPDEDGTEAVRNWEVSHYSGTRSPDAEGTKPFFEPVKFTIEHRFLQADRVWTEDLFAAMAAATSKGQPFAANDQAAYLALYDLHQGKPFRGPDAQVTNPTVGDKISATAVERWVFENRLDEKYATSFTDIETGEQHSGVFITPDPDAIYDPFYTASGKKDLDRMPQGPTTSVTFFVLDTFSDAELTAKYFDRNAYHFYDVTKDDLSLDPDTKTHDGPDYTRVWGGRYHFFFHDLGAGPNAYEAVDFFLGAVPGSAAYPSGDPPIWDYENDPKWQGMLVERTARDAVTMLLYRFVAPYLYRPVPADVYFLAAINWNDCYANPECSPEGISKTDLTKIYQPSYVETNLSSAMPGVTFTTERSIPHLKTYRDLGCSTERALSNPDPQSLPGGPVIMMPNPACAEDDPIQHALEEAKARGDDLLGAGVNDFGASGNVVRRFVEENRNDLAPTQAGQLTLTNISVVWPGGTTWFLPAIVGGVALGTPNDEAWGILNNVNERSKTYMATDCATSKPFAPGCNGVPPVANPGSGFSYIVQHEASHFLGLLHPHDSLTVEKDTTGKWQYYGNSYRHYGDFSQAPTTYAGNFSPYSVLDQDIVQRGHTAEYLRQVQDHLADAYLLDGAEGLTAPSAQTQRKESESTRWRDQATALFACGDYLHAERAMRNAALAASGVFGPVIPPRPLVAGENVLLEVTPQAVYGVDGEPVPGCQAGRSVQLTDGPVSETPNQSAGTGGTGTTAVAGSRLPATGGAALLPLVGLLLVAAAGAVRRRRRVA